MGSRKSICIERGGSRVEEGRGGIAPFPLPAHRTGLADFPHPALRLASPQGTRWTATFRRVSRDDTVARDQPSPCGRAPSEASGYLQVLPGSSPITLPRLLRKRTRSQGPFLRRHYPASTVLWPCPTPARPTVHATALEARPPTETGLPRLPGPPSQRAVPITPVDRNGCIRRLLPHSTRPSPDHATETYWRRPNPARHAMPA